MHDLLSPSGFRALVEVSGWAVGLTLALLVVWTFLLGYFYQGFVAHPSVSTPAVVGPVLLVLLLPCLGPWQVPNEVTLFLRSAKRFLHNPAMAAIAHVNRPSH